MRKILLFSLSVLLLNGCGKKSDQEPAAASETKDQQQLARASNILIESFSKELKSELLAALNEGGPENAISVCQVKAPEIAAAHANEFWSIRRVSDRNRNPDNLASEFEQGLLARFKDTTQPTPEYIIGWSPTEAGKMYRHFRPITISQLCLQCHGGPDDIEQAVQAILAEKYPGDRAIGYTVGDLRGLYVVDVRWPEGKAFVDSVITASEQPGADSQ